MIYQSWGGYLDNCKLEMEVDAAVRFQDAQLNEYRV
jgi:hypothetical protein